LCLMALYFWKGAAIEELLFRSFPGS
jgi:hypothetical protein